MDEPRELTTEKERTALQAISRGMDVLEIGSYDGVTACALAKVARNVHCVDPFMGQINVNIQPSLEKWIQNTRGFFNIFLHYGPSHKILPFFRDRAFQVIFIDGNHDYDFVRMDVLNSFRLLTMKGYVAFHDFHWDGVAKVIKQNFGGEPFIIDNLAIYSEPQYIGPR